MVERVFLTSSSVGRTELSVVMVRPVRRERLEIASHGQKRQRRMNILHTTRVEAGFVDGVGEHYKEMSAPARHGGAKTRKTHL